MAAQRQYETTYILLPDLDESERATVQDRVKEIVEGEFKGEILKVDEWGRRPLAYALRKERFGYYFHVRYRAEGAVVAELERILRLTDPVMKYLTVRLDESAEIEAGAEAS